MLVTVANNTFEISAKDECLAWKGVKSHYQVFEEQDAAAREPLFRICVRNGKIDIDTLGPKAMIMEEEAAESDMMSMSLYELADKSLVFALDYPQTPQVNGWLIVNPERTSFEVVIDPSAGDQWLQEATLTSGAMLAYLLGTTMHHTLTMHASCVVADGKAYLFLGKSGTGKSTHARLWLKNIPGTMLLNDDHPIIKLDAEGCPIVYGSPWSGKTHCYKNKQAPIGGIVKIERAPYNRIHRLRPLEAYSKLIVSASGMTFDKSLADSRHHAIEQTIRHVPFYVMECLPDDEAAIVCHDNVIPR